jgi:hypothetical protein
MSRWPEKKKSLTLDTGQWGRGMKKREEKRGKSV